MRPKPYYIQFLTDELARRKSKNPRYSLRAFATYLLLDPSALSRIFGGKQELSLQAAVRIMKKIACTEYERIQFLTSLSEDKMNRAAAILSKALNLPGTAFAAAADAEKYRSLLDLLPHPAWIVKTDGTVEYCNHFFREHLGTPPPFPSGWADLIHPEDLGDFLKTWNEAERERKPFNCELRMRFRTGEYHPHEALITPCKDQNGRLLRWNGFGNRKKI